MKQAYNEVILRTFFGTLATVLTVQFVQLPAYAQYAQLNSHAPNIGSSIPKFDGKSQATIERRRYLYNLGFNDESSIIRDQLQKRQYYGELNRRQMIDNAKSFEVLNASRELSLMIMESVDEQMNRGGNSDKRKATELAQFAAKLLALKPLPPRIDIPSEIIDMEQSEARDEALAKTLAEDRSERMNEQKKRMLSDVLNIMNIGNINEKVSEIQLIDKYLAEIIDSMYHDDTRGRARNFGRTLALLLKREDIKGSGKDYFATMKKELSERYNDFIENYIGDTIIKKTSDGKIVSEKIQSGDQILTRNLSPGSLQISFAAIPSNLWIRWKARFKGMIGTPLAVFFYTSSEDMENGISLATRIKERISQAGIFRQGFSHIGTFAVYEDPDTAVRVLYVIDNYPNEIADITQKEVRTGGVRRITLEQFVNFEHHSAFHIAKIDSNKFYKWAIENYKKNGYQKEFYRMNEVKMNGVLPEKTDKEVTMKTAISEEDFHKLYSERDPLIFKNKAMDLFVKTLVDYIRRGVTFHWPEAPLDFIFPDSIYCALTLDSAMRESIGLSLEQYKSDWHWAIHGAAYVGKTGLMLKKMGFEKLGEKLLDLPQVRKSMKMADLDILAPINSALQPFMNGVTIRLPNRSPEQKTQSNSSEYYVINNNLYQQLNGVNLLHFAANNFDPIASAAAAIQESEYITIMRGSRGLVPVKFSDIRMAELATEKAIPAVLEEMNTHQQLDYSGEKH